MHHPGDLEVDYDHWPDHDERCHGPIDTNSNRREYPSSFRWSCCEALGDEGGCEKGEGESLVDRYPDSPDSEGPSSDSDEEHHHTGDLEVDYDGDFWADHDEDCHGTIDTNTNRREHPEGFKWSCCGEPGGSQGCEER